MTEIQESGLSYWHTPDDQPLKWLTIPHYIDHWAERKPQQEAYVVRRRGQPREVVTYGDLKQKTEQIAAGLLELGLVQGDFIIITGITCINWILLDLACASIGVHTIRCSLRILTKESLITIANNYKVRTLAYHPGENRELQKHLSKCIPDAFVKSDQNDIFCRDIPSLKHVISLAYSQDDTTPTNSVDQLLTQQHSPDRVQRIKANIQPESILTVYMTSGSTGFPKAIPYTHFMVVNAFSRHPSVPTLMEGDDRFFTERSPDWLGAQMHLPLMHGSCSVYVHTMMNAKDADVNFSIQVIHEERVTCGFFLQCMITDIVRQLSSGNANRFFLRWIYSGGDALIPSSLEKLEMLCGEVCVGYACTETIFLASCTGTAEVKRYLQYAGKVIKGIEVKIVDKGGKVVPLGQTGEIVVRSPFAFRGYLQRETKGVEVDGYGWISTGDAGCLDDGGMLKVLGRKSDVISRGLALIYPFAVEQVIIQFAGVSLVAVVGVPDKRLQQNICACIVPQQGVFLTSDDMLRCFDDLYQTDEGLGMTPAYFLFLQQLPTLNGKVDRKELARMAIQKFGIKM